MSTRDGGRIAALATWMRLAERTSLTRLFRTTTEELSVTWRVRPEGLAW